MIYAIITKYENNKNFNVNIYGKDFIAFTENNDKDNFLYFTNDLKLIEKDFVTVISLMKGITGVIKDISELRSVLKKIKIKQTKINYVRIAYDERLEEIFKNDLRKQLTFFIQYANKHNQHIIPTLKYPQAHNIKLKNIINIKKSQNDEGGNMNEILLEKYTKASQHYEDNKIQTKKDKQCNLFESLDKRAESKEAIERRKAKKLKKQAEEYEVFYKGIDLTEAEHTCIHALQTLMTQTDYYGNYLKNKDIKPIIFTPAGYFEAYGVKKNKTKRGKVEYSGKGKETALKALKNLLDKKVYIYYRRRYKEKDKKTNRIKNMVEIIENINTLISLSNLYNLEEKEERDFWRGKNKKDKLVKIGVLPNNVLIEQIDKYFVMKPQNYINEIKNKYPNVSKFTLRFIDLLMSYVAKNTNTKHKRQNFNWKLERGWKDIAVNIRLDKSSYWKSGQKGKCRKIINRF